MPLLSSSMQDLAVLFNLFPAPATLGCIGLSCATTRRLSIQNASPSAKSQLKTLTCSRFEVRILNLPSSFDPPEYLWAIVLLRQSYYPRYEQHRAELMRSLLGVAHLRRKPSGFLILLILDNQGHRPSIKMTEVHTNVNVLIISLMLAKHLFNCKTVSWIPCARLGPCSPLLSLQSQESQQDFELPGSRMLEQTVSLRVLAS